MMMKTESGDFVDAEFVADLNESFQGVSSRPVETDLGSAVEENLVFATGSPQEDTTGYDLVSKSALDEHGCQAVDGPIGLRDYTDSRAPFCMPGRCRCGGNTWPNGFNKTWQCEECGEVFEE